MDLKPVRISAYGDYEITHDTARSFNMIDNYIYLYHTDTWIALPCWPDNISDSMGAEFSTESPLARSAPIFSYSHSGPRSFTVNMTLHREMFNDINYSTSNFKDTLNDDYVDVLIKNLQSAAVPNYSVAQKMVDPPMVAVRFGNDIFCKGIINGSINVTYSLPILKNDKYAVVAIGFTINEIDPYGAADIMQQGSFRGLSTADLERKFI